MVCCGEAGESTVFVVGKSLLTHNCTLSKRMPYCPFVKAEAALDIHRDAGLSDWEINKWKKRTFLG